MKGIKLTPLNMFLLLLIVVVISLFIGYSVKEGATSMSSNMSKAPTRVFTPYSTDNLVIIKGDVSSDVQSGDILFDTQSGNFINVSGATDFKVVSRNGNEVDNSSQLLNWSYSFHGATIVNITWDNKTIVYYIENNNGDGKMMHIFNGDDSIMYMDTSLSNTPLTTTGSASSIVGKSLCQINGNVSFSVENGIFVKNSSNSYDNVHHSTGSSMIYSSNDDSTVISTNTVEDMKPAAIVIILTKSGSGYDLNTTVRITGTCPNSNPPRHPDSEHHRQDHHQHHRQHHRHPDSDYPDSPYILKTEIVPPVCPMCPGTGCDDDKTSSPDVCSVSVNSEGQLVDCHGNVVTPYSSPSPASITPSSTTITPSSTTSSPGTSFGQSITGAYDTTVTTAGDVVNTGVTTAGDAIKDVTSGVEGTATGLGKDVSNIITGVTGDVTGLAEKTVDSATGLVRDAGAGAYSLAHDTGSGIYSLAHDTGSGIYSLANQAKYIDAYGVYRNEYGQPVQGVAQQANQGQVIYPGAPLYPGYGTCAPPQYPAIPKGYEPMGITADFSQFS